MRSIILYIATSLDNYIARPNGAVDWLDYPEFLLEGEDYDYPAFYEDIDTTLMGNKTYQEVLGFDVPFPYKEKKNYVFTRSANLDKAPYVAFISGDIVNFVKKLKEEPGKNIWLIGGGTINTLMYQHDLIDKIIWTKVPVILGEGIPIFNGALSETKWKLKHNKTFSNGFTQLTLEKFGINSN